MASFGGSEFTQSKGFIVFDDVIADMISSKKCNPEVTGLFIRGRKLNLHLFLQRNHILKYQRC